MASWETGMLRLGGVTVGEIEGDLVPLTVGEIVGRYVGHF